MGGMLPAKEFEFRHFNPKANLKYCSVDDCTRLESRHGKCERCHALDWYHLELAKERYNANSRR